MKTARSAHAHIHSYHRDLLRRDAREELQKAMLFVMKVKAANPPWIRCQAKVQQLSVWVKLAQDVHEEVWQAWREEVSRRRALRPPEHPDQHQCTACGEELGSFSRKHHCQHCGRAHCPGCCSRRLPIPNLGFSFEAVRVCDQCAQTVTGSGGVPSIVPGAAPPTAPPAYPGATSPTNTNSPPLSPRDAVGPSRFDANGEQRDSQAMGAFTHGRSPWPPNRIPESPPEANHRKSIAAPSSDEGLLSTQARGPVLGGQTAPAFRVLSDVGQAAAAAAVSIPAPSPRWAGQRGVQEESGVLHSRHASNPRARSQHQPSQSISRAHSRDSGHEPHQADDESQPFRFSPVVGQKESTLGMRLWAALLDDDHSQSQRIPGTAADTRDELGLGAGEGIGPPPLPYRERVRNNASTAEETLPAGAVPLKTFHLVCSMSVAKHDKGAVSCDCSLNLGDHLKGANSCWLVWQLNLPDHLLKNIRFSIHERLRFGRTVPRLEEVAHGKVTLASCFCDPGRIFVKQLDYQDPDTRTMYSNADAFKHIGFEEFSINTFIYGIPSQITE
mmetsp:Transcript_23630/g.45013  ORF Transcript_23630/g.45013 Transcript_23630/m.45013 type:complete len:556 (-) Transcript_23630:259-1926(-)